MEKKTKYRILGILVIIALVVILLPFFRTNNEFTSQTAVIKAPPFPDQPVQISASSEVKESQSISEPQETAEANDSGIKLDDVISATHPSVINDVQVPEIGAPSKEIERAKEAPDETHQTQIPHSLLTDNESSIKRNSIAENNEVKKAQVDPTPDTNVNLASTKKISPQETSTHDNGLFDLKSAAWVIQIGSFKNKANALRMVNQLRANGYRAFIQKISTALGDNTRVFVGPENKIRDANELALRIENDLHIRGIVISYKPLSL